MASAALIADSRVQTKRRSFGKEQQEAFVKQTLKQLGLKEVATREIRRPPTRASPLSFGHIFRSPHPLVPPP